MKTLDELEELEAMRNSTSLRGQALLDYFDVHQNKGETFIKRHEMKRSAASFCMETDKYLAEMRFFRQSGYQDFRPCLATLRDIQRIKGADCETVVQYLVEQMNRQFQALFPSKSATA